MQIKDCLGKEHILSSTSAWSCLMAGWKRIWPGWCLTSSSPYCRRLCHAASERTAEQTSHWLSLSKGKRSSPWHAVSTFLRSLLLNLQVPFFSGFCLKFVSQICHQWGHWVCNCSVVTLAPKVPVLWAQDWNLVQVTGYLLPANTVSCISHFYSLLVISLIQSSRERERIVHKYNRESKKTVRTGLVPTPFLIQRDYLFSQKTTISAIIATDSMNPRMESITMTTPLSKGKQRTSANASKCLTVKPP